MRRYKIAPWILLILSIINVTLAAPVVLRKIRHACVDVMDVREDAMPVSRSEKQNDELMEKNDELMEKNDELMEKLWDKPSPAMHPRTSPAPSESGYESALDSPNSYQTATSEVEQASPGEESSIGSESHRTYDGASSENYLASNEGSSRSSSYLSSNLPIEEPEPGSNPSASGLPAAEPKSGTQKSFLSKLVSKSKSFLSKLASKSKNFFRNLAGKLKSWPRTPESVVRLTPGVL
jgi:hypothetical protein